MVIIQPSRPKIKRQRQDTPHTVGASIGSVVVTGLDTQVLFPNTQVLPAIYVSPTGSDSGAGTEADPFETLERARDEMRSSAFTRVYLRGGTYNRTSALLLNSNDASTEWLAFPTETPVIDGGDNDIRLFDLSGANGVVFKDLTLQNTDDPSKGSGVGNDSAVQIDDSDDVIVEGCTFDGCYISIGISGTSLRTLILGNTINDYGWQGIQIRGNFGGQVQDAKIAGNTFDGSGTSRTQDSFAISANNLQDCIFEYNSFNDIFYGAFQFGDGGDKTNVGNIIRYNYLINTDTGGDDNGGIYFGGKSMTQTNMTVDSNWIENVGTTTTVPPAGFKAQSCVYLDDATNAVTIINNVMIPGANGEYGVHNHGGNNHTIQNNIMLLGNYPTNGARSGHRSVFNQGQGSLSNPLNDNVINVNIMLSVDANKAPAAFDGSDHLHEGSTDDPDYQEPSSIDGNIKWQNIADHAGDTNETNAVNSDPGFADPGNDDLTLSSSPGSFQHIAGITDGGTFVWGAPGTNANSDYNRSNY